MAMALGVLVRLPFEDFVQTNGLFSSGSEQRPVNSLVERSGNLSQIGKVWERFG